MTEILRVLDDDQAYPDPAPSIAILAIEQEAAAIERRRVVERIRRAIVAVAEHERYDLQYSAEVARLARDVAARLADEVTTP